MGAEFTYLHSIPGRLRVKVPEVKRSPEAAERLERGLRDLVPVGEVRANPRTGNVLVRYEPGGTGPDRIIEAIRALGYLRGAGAELGTGPAAQATRIGETLLDALSSAASKLLLEAIFGPIGGGVLGTLLVGAESVGVRIAPEGLGRRAGEIPPLEGRRAVA
ncbi:MAG TPA: hypothetical protein VF590_00075 [Isosphaeraceae bacterium]|jgi:hypothetical protein